MLFDPVDDSALGLLFGKFPYLALLAHSTDVATTDRTAGWLLAGSGGQGSSVQFGLKHLNLVVPLHDHSFLFLAFGNLFLQFVLG